MSTERVQKILAQAGIASRRKAEELIREGQVTINGQIAKLGDKADLSKDAIKVSGKLLRTTEAPVYVAFHKPKGVISMFVDPQGRATLADFITGKIEGRLFPIGRLDFNSEGLILLTNDGDFAQKLQTREDVPRVYNVKVKGHPSQEDLERLRRGTKIEGKIIQPHSVRIADDFNKKSMVEVVFLGTGAIDIKTFFEMKGILTERMIRTAIGHVTLKGIGPGEFKLLKKSQVEALLEQPELGMRMVTEDIEKGEAKRERKVRFQERADEREAARGPRKVIRPNAGGARGPKIIAPKGEGRSERAPRFNRDERSDRAPRFDRSDRPSRPGGFKPAYRDRDDRGSFGGGESRGGWGKKPAFRDESESRGGGWKKSAPRRDRDETGSRSSSGGGWKKTSPRAGGAGGGYNPRPKFGGGGGFASSGSTRSESARGPRRTPSAGGGRTPTPRVRRRPGSES